MGDTRGEEPEGGHLLLVEEPGLQLLLLRDDLLDEKHMTLTVRQVERVALHGKHLTGP